MLRHEVHGKAEPLDSCRQAKEGVREGKRKGLRFPLLLVMTLLVILDNVLVRLESPVQLPPKGSIHL